MKKQYKVTICGHYANGTKANEGQTVKTRAIYNALVNKFGAGKIYLCDTHNWGKRPLRLLIKTLLGALRSENVVIMPAHGGLKVFVPLCYIFSKVSACNIHYVVIGGWLNEYLERHKITRFLLMRYDTIYVETTTMKANLERTHSLTNVTILSNFKTLRIVDKGQLNTKVKKPLKVCTYSRVMKEKGIEDLIQVIADINSAAKKPVFLLDIYGRIEKGYEIRFEELLKLHPESISYKGIVDSLESVSVLKEYYMLIFPTKYRTEGLPGTIIDAYAAGLPILSAKWDSYSDIIEENVTGIGYTINDLADLKRKLLLCTDTKLISAMKANCTKKAHLYTEKAAMSIFYKDMG